MTPRRANGRVANARQASRIKALRGIWANDGVGTEVLLEECRRERELEERKAENRGVGRL
jgi:hypothetical protein